jgi:acetyl esterase/lipase
VLSRYQYLRFIIAIILLVISQRFKFLPASVLLLPLDKTTTHKCIREIMKILYSLFPLFIFFVGACTSNLPKHTTEQVIKNAEVLRASVLQNVSFAQVMALDVAPNASEKIAYGSNVLQYGQLYLPENVRGKGIESTAPLVVFVHGGCWLNAFSVDHSEAFSQALTKEGYAVWSIEYRRTGDDGGGWPGSLNDVLKGVSFVQTFKDYPIDLNKVILAGHSAGGHLALLASAPERQVFKGGAELKGVIGLAAIVDVVRYSQGNNSCQTATPAFFGGSAEQKPEAYALGSPDHHVLKEHSLLLQGSADAIVEQSQALKSGFEYQIVEGAGHFDWIHPETNAYQAFLSALKQRVSK